MVNIKVKFLNREIGENKKMKKILIFVKKSWLNPLTYENDFLL